MRNELECQYLFVVSSSLRCGSMRCIFLRSCGWTDEWRGSQCDILLANSEMFVTWQLEVLRRMWETLNGILPAKITRLTLFCDDECSSVWNVCRDCIWFVCVRPTSGDPKTAKESAHKERCVNISGNAEKPKQWSQFQLPHSAGRGLTNAKRRAER